MKYFTIPELCRSNTAKQLGIENEPNAYQRANLEKLVNHLLDPIRKMWGKPIIVNSGFRSEELNRAVGGARNSEHLSGCAADITVGSKTMNRFLFDMIRTAEHLEWRQLIDEHDYSWIHISYREGDSKKQILHL